MSGPVTVFLTEHLRELLSHPQNVLGRSEYRVVSARGGDVAYEVINELRPRLAALEEGEGAAVCSRLKAHEETREIVVLVTACGADAEDVAQTARDVGADSVLTGSFSPQQLIDRIGELLAIPIYQRRHVRALFGVSFDGKTVTGTFLGNTVNVSEGGMLVEADQDLPLGERIECRFFLPGDQKPVDIKGKVVRKAPEVKGQMQAYGVVFTTVPDEDMARIRHYVSIRRG